MTERSKEHVRVVDVTYGEHTHEELLGERRWNYYLTTIMENAVYTNV